MNAARSGFKRSALEKKALYTSLCSSISQGAIPTVPEYEIPSTDLVHWGGATAASSAGVGALGGVPFLKSWGMGLLVGGVLGVVGGSMGTVSLQSVPLLTPTPTLSNEKLDDPVAALTPAAVKREPVDAGKAKEEPPSTRAGSFGAGFSGRN